MATVSRDSIRSLITELGASVEANSISPTDVATIMEYLLDMTVADLSVGAGQIANSAVTTGKIEDGAVTTAKIADDAVTTDKLAAGAVGTTALADLSVRNAKLAVNAVTESKIADSSVTTNKIDSAAITTDKVADGAITSEKIATSAVTTDKLLTWSVTTAKIAQAAVTTSKIADLTITNAKLASNAVTESKIADESVTLAKIDPSIIDATPTSNSNNLVKSGGVKAALHNLEESLYIPIFTLESTYNEILNIYNERGMSFMLLYNNAGDEVFYMLTNYDAYSNRFVFSRAATEGVSSYTIDSDSSWNYNEVEKLDTITNAQFNEIFD